MDETLSQLTDDIGACERIFKTPIPRVYTGHTSRFTGTWLFLLPLALVGIDPSWNRLVSVPSAALITFFMLGIEELGLQIEEPFSLLPIESFCDDSIGGPIHAMVIDEDKTRKEEALSRGVAIMGNKGVDTASALDDFDATDPTFPFSDEWVKGIRRESSA